MIYDIIESMLLVPPRVKKAFYCGWYFNLHHSIFSTSVHCKVIKPLIKKTNRVLDNIPNTPPIILELNITDIMERWRHHFETLIWVIERIILHWRIWHLPSIKKTLQFFVQREQLHTGWKLKMSDNSITHVAEAIRQSKKQNQLNFYSVFHCYCSCYFVNILIGRENDPRTCIRRDMDIISNTDLIAKLLLS